MADKYLDVVAGIPTQKTATSTSTGVANAGNIVALDGSGKLDNSLLPVGIGADTKTLPSFENLAAGDFVNIFNDSGTVKVRKADASTTGKQSDGFVLAAVTAPANAIVYFEGTNTQQSGLTGGSRYYLSASTPGAATTTAPSGSGNVVQYIGKSLSTTEISFEPSNPIVLA